ncbi:MAG: YceI family protein [Flavobacteriales bacterium TMED96]|nr:MAG: YceI family protein [Flavobacteriales bacterium TMED96]|tara:strand:- start:4280 stop:4831 length:552 start_codon:yes stop_codon:yes gene_type:complete
MIRYLLIFPLFLITNQIFSQTIKWSLDSNDSFISYDGEHFLHSWSGKNEIIRGVIIENLEEKKFKQIALAMFVKDFDSGNGNRDSNMLEILEVIKFPKIEYYSNRISLDKDKILFSGNLNFHGISRDLNITSEIKKTKNILVLSGEFNFSLVDHNVKLPSFMMRSINKDVLIKYQLIFNKIDN